MNWTWMHGCRGSTRNSSRQRLAHVVEMTTMSLQMTRAQQRMLPPQTMCSPGVAEQVSAKVRHHWASIQFERWTPDIRRFQLQKSAVP